MKFPQLETTIEKAPFIASAEWDQKITELENTDEIPIKIFAKSN